MRMKWIVTRTRPVLSAGCALGVKRIVCAVAFRYGQDFVPTSVVVAAVLTLAPVWKAVELVVPMTVNVAAVGITVVTRTLTPTTMTFDGI